MTSSSGPIATSTPVNFAVGSVAPPPLSLASSQLGQQEPAIMTSAIAGTPGAKASSYPAVLKGRTAASPPIPNLVPSGKVPPPVPPRGTGHRSAATSSASSSRGDEAAIITKYRLHESSSILHHPPPPSATTSTSTSTSAVAALATSSSASANTHYHPSRESEPAFGATVPPEFLHARVSTTPAYLPPPRYDSLAVKSRMGRQEDIIREEHTLRDWTRWRENMLPAEEDEFVSVEKVDDSYIIRTSPHPFRPERGHYRNKDLPMSTTPSDGGSFRSAGPSNPNTMAKFTYFINPAARPELMNYRMSRKDKKHSETYYERMKRKQKELEASINTITSLNYRGQGSRNMEPVQKPTRDRIKLESTITSHLKSKENREGPKPVENVSKFSETRRDSRLMRKIKEKSAQRRKKLAPEPSPTALDFPTNRESRKVESYDRPTTSSVNQEYITSSSQAMPMKRVPGSQEPSQKTKVIQRKVSKKTFTVTRVDERETRKNRSNETVAKLLEDNEKPSSSAIKVEERVWTAEDPELTDLSDRSIVSNKVEIFQEARSYLTLIPPSQDSTSRSSKTELALPMRREIGASKESLSETRTPKSMAPPIPHLKVTTTDRYESSKSLPATLTERSPNLLRPNKSFLHSHRRDPRLKNN